MFYTAKSLAIRFPDKIRMKGRTGGRPGDRSDSRRIVHQCLPHFLDSLYTQRSLLSPTVHGLRVVILRAGGRATGRADRRSARRTGNGRLAQTFFLHNPDHVDKESRIPLMAGLRTGVRGRAFGRSVGRADPWSIDRKARRTGGGLPELSKNPKPRGAPGTLHEATR